MSLLCFVAAGAHPDALLLLLEQTRPLSVGTLEALSDLSRNSKQAFIQISYIKYHRRMHQKISRSNPENCQVRTPIAEDC